MQSIVADETTENIGSPQVPNDVSDKKYPDEIIKEHLSVDGYSNVLIHEFEGSKIIIASNSTDRNISFLNKVRELPETGHVGGKFTSFGY